METPLHTGSLLKAGSLLKTGSLVKSLAQSLITPAEDTAPAAPVVYTTAIRSTDSLGESLTGISLLGFTHATETLYAADCHSAAFHADHAIRAVSLAVECNPRQQTVSLAVSGLETQDTFDTFQAVASALFGDC